MHPQIPNGIIESEVIVLAFEIDQTKESWTDYTDILSINETERAQEFYYPEDKLRFSKCRSILRNALSKWGDNSPEELKIAVSTNGKPYLNQKENIKFSISHTEGFAGIAFSRNHEIGIDVENRDRNTNVDEVAKKVFTPIEREIINTESGIDKRKLFFRFWTSKEAFLKNIGLGLGLDPKKVNLNLQGENRKYSTLECSHIPYASSLRLVELACPEPYIMTVCAFEEASENLNVVFL